METKYEGRPIVELSELELQAAVVKLKEDNRELLKLISERDEKNIKEISKRNN